MADDREPVGPNGSVLTVISRPPNTRQPTSHRVTVGNRTETFVVVEIGERKKKKLRFLHGNRRKEKRIATNAGIALGLGA